MRGSHNHDCLFRTRLPSPLIFSCAISLTSIVFLLHICFRDTVASPDSYSVDWKLLVPRVPWPGLHLRVILLCYPISPCDRASSNKPGAFLGSLRPSCCYPKSVLNGLHGSMTTRSNLKLYNGFQGWSNYLPSRHLVASYHIPSPYSQIFEPVP